MKLTEDELRKLALIAIEELGENANPDSVKRVVTNIINKIDSKEPELKIADDKSTGRIIITAFGLNKPGIVASITKALGDAMCDIQDISQKLMNEFFTMIMVVDISNSPKDFKDIQDLLTDVANSLKIKIYCQHEDIFRNMHRI